MDPGIISIPTTNTFKSMKRLEILKTSTIMKENL